jgi:prophage tail gpP-like protein
MPSNNGARGSEDRVLLTLGGETVHVAQHYEIKASILTQPACFSMTFGTPGAARYLFIQYPPRTSFELQIEDTLIQSGFTDGYSISSEATLLAVHGRDSMAELHDGMIKQEFTIKDATYAQLGKKLIEYAGLSSKLVYTNKANRRAITGGHSSELQPPRDVEQDKIETDGGGTVKRDVEAKLGERIYEFGKRHFDHGGLFFWASGDGNFILSEPNPHQTPIYQLIRSYGKPARGTIISERFENRTEGRYAGCDVYTRGGSKKRGRSTATGSFEDLEMHEWGYTKRLTVKDVSADTPARAEFWARKKIAETRRAGWRLSYTVMGHTTTAIGGGKAVWAPDTMVYVDDDKLGIKRALYIEGVTFRSSPQATTTLDLMRGEDLVFAPGNGEDGPQPTLPGGIPSDIAI